jgi:hypothetical protein
LKDYFGVDFKISLNNKPSYGEVLITEHNLIYKPYKKFTSEDKFNLIISNQNEKSNIFTVKIKDLTVK